MAEGRHQSTDLLAPDRGQVRFHPQGVVAIGPLAVELMAQLVVGQLEGVLPLALQALQVEAPLEIELVAVEPGMPRH